jgi:MoaA/NifB/PqqE/SkfB family radical SAM enzyme
MKRLLGAVNRLSCAVGGLPVIERVARPIWCALTSCLPLDLTYSDSTLWISLELTSRCNLRCVYCGKSNSDEGKRAFDFPEEWIEPSMKTLRRRGLWLVAASGIGESTMRKGWQDICRSLHDAGLNLTIISNFARPLTPEEIDVLVRFGSIQVSVDTADRELFARIRRGARLETVLMNIERVRTHAKSKGIRQPEFRFDMVITDKTILGIEELVRLGLEHGVTDFYFANLCKGADIKGDFNVYNATTLPRAKLTEGLACLERAVELAKRAACKVDCHSGLLDSIRAELNGTAGGCETPESTGGSASWGAPGVPEGMTRDCAEPWKYANLCAHGEVRPCCAYDYPVGDLRTETLEEIVNGPKIRQFRQNLLSGRLEGSLCMHCSMQPQVPIGEFRRRMSGRLVLWSLRRRILNSFQAIARA